MKKTMKRLFAILMTLAIAITAIPMMEVKAAEGYTIEKVTLPVDSITLDNENPNVSIDGAEFKITGIDQSISFLRAIYLCENTDEYVEVILYKSDVTDIYTGYIYCDKDVESGTYVLDYVLIFFENNSSARIYENIPESSVTVVNNITDFTAPEMTGFAFEQDGQTFTQGTDTVIEFTAEDIFDNEDGVGIHFDKNNGDAVIHLYSNGSEHPCWVRFVKETDGTYKASVAVDKLANAEWYIYYVGIEDKLGNRITYDFYEEGIYYNFFVKNSEGECNSSRDITVNFYDEEDELIKTKEGTATSGEVVLADLLDEIPAYVSEMGFVGWKCDETDQMLEDDTVFIAASTENEFNFYPVTVKKYVEVNLRILDEDGEMNWTSEEYLIDGDATYQDLVALLPTPPTVNGCAFVEWDLGGYKLTDIVEDDWVNLWAVYDKQLIEVACYYMDEDGKFAYETITLSFSADEVVTYEKVLAQVPEFETYEGVSFLKWEILDGTTDLTQELEYDWVELEAIYDKYPVTIERTYVDTTGAVKNEKVTKLYPAGTTMESIYDEYAVTPSDASTSLSIEKWQVDEGNPEEEISEYNNVLALTALYDEKTIVEVCYDYIAPMDDHGVEKKVYSYEVIAKDIASDVDALTEYCKNTVEGKFTFEHYSGYEFLGWDYENPSYAYTNDDSIIDSINIMAKINIEEVISVVAALGMDMTGEPEDVYYYVVEAGDTFTLPEQYDGYYLKWYDMMQQYEEVKDGKYIIPSDAVAGDYYLFMSEKTDKVPAQDNPPADNQQGGTTQPGNTNNNVPAQDNPPADNQQGGTTQPDNTNNNVPPTADTTTAIPYITLLLFGAGVFMVGSKRRNFVR